MGRPSANPSDPDFRLLLWKWIGCSFFGSERESEKLVDLRDSRVAGVAIRLAG